MDYQGTPIYTISKGNIVMENGIVNKDYRGFGEIIRRS